MGLNYGYTYKAKKGIRMGKELGVTYNEGTGKYIVRVLNKSKQVTTLAQFPDKELAEECLENYNEKNK